VSKVQQTSEGEKCSIRHTASVQLVGICLCQSRSEPSISCISCPATPPWSFWVTLITPPTRPCCTSSWGSTADRRPVPHLDWSRAARESGHLVHFGVSRSTRRSVAALPIDIELIILSQILALAIAIPLAMRSARKPDRPDRPPVQRRQLHVLSIPPFIVIVFLVLLVSIKGGGQYRAVGLRRVQRRLDCHLESLSSPPSRSAIGASRCTFACCAAISSRRCRKIHNHGALQGASVAVALCGVTPFARRQSPVG